jgi:uncharacterized protein
VRISELAIFGSAVHDDFRDDSDVDVLVTFETPAQWTLFDLGHMEDELSGIFGRKVDTVDRGGVEESKNYVRRRAILDSAQTVYAAR